MNVVRACKKAVVGVTITVTAGALLTGCVTTAGGTLGDLTRASEAAASDLHSIELALSLYSGGKTTRAVTTTTIDDAVSDLTTQQETVSSLDVRSSRERTARAATLKRLDVGVHASIRSMEAVEAVHGALSATAAHDAARAAATRLQKLAGDLEKLW